jgi:signal transduction histidine kinase
MVDTLQLLALNLVYWYVPALVAPVIVAIATRYRVGRAPWATVISVHAAGAIAYALFHEAVMLGTHPLIFPNGAVSHAFLTGNWSPIVRESLQQLDWLFMTYLFFVGLAHALAYRRESEAQELNSAQLRTRLVEAQLQSLQRQLHPHFLFNTLAAISGLMRSNIEAADRMVDQLGDLLRMTLHSSGAQQVPLKDDLDVLQKYLEIEQTRFGGRLEIRMDIEPETFDALVPNLLLQPLVENAVRHGVAPHARPGWIAIRAARAASRLIVDVTDSGDGVPPERLQQLNHGVGLSNTRARLDHLYGTDCLLMFTNLPDGFRVTVGVPFRQEAAADSIRQGAA